MGTLRNGFLQGTVDVETSPGFEGSLGGLPGEEFAVAQGIAFCRYLRPIFPFTPISSLVSGIQCHHLQGTGQLSQSQR